MRNEGTPFHNQPPLGGVSLGLSRDLTTMNTPRKKRQQSSLTHRYAFSSNSDFCYPEQAMEETLTRFGRSEIFNNDRAASSPAGNSPRCRPTWVYRSAWTANVRGGTISWWNGSGGRSNTRRTASAPTLPCPKPGPRLAARPRSSTAGDRIHRLTAKPTIRLTSASYPP